MASSPVISGDVSPVDSHKSLIDYFAAGEKPQAQFRIGAEHEKFVFHRNDLSRPAYDGPNGIEALLKGLTRFGWAEVCEKGKLIALSRDGASVSLEPGGQFELSGAPLESVHDIAAETARHLDEVKVVGGELGLGFLGVGFSPLWSREQTPVMPKGRYNIMRAYMPKVGNLGLDMMLRTSTIQANLDYSSETDMVLKFRVALSLQPLATALFANSPFTEGKPNGFLSARANVWTDTDSDRTGMLGFVFEDGFGYERYAQYALDVPMYFVKRDDYIDASGQSFRAFLKGELPALTGERPTIDDWGDHLTTLFPEVRLKKYLEMRGADGGPQSHINALAAFWAGILYDQTALEAAWDLVKNWTQSERLQWRAQAAKTGLKGEIAGRAVKDWATDVLKIAEAGLKRRGRLSETGQDESVYLAPLFDIADSGLTLADRWLEKYQGEWGGVVDPIYIEAAY